MNIKKLEPNDLKKFINSWEIVFSRKMDHAFYKWVFHRNNNIYCCYDNNDIVGGYCLMEQKSLINGEIFSTGLCNNVFIKGFKYLKSNLFKELTEYSLSNFSEKHSLAFGFPNKKSIKSHLRAGWDNPLDLKCMEINKNKLPLPNLTTVNFFTKPVDEEVVIEISKRLQYQIDYSFKQIRDVDFLGWRYSSNPRYSYFATLSSKNNSFIIWKYFSERRRIHILDSSIEGSQDLTHLIQSLLIYTHQNSLQFSYIDLWVPPAQNDFFSKAGFEEFDKQPVIINNLGNTHSKVDFNSSYFSLSDNDVY